MAEPKPKSLGDGEPLMRKRTPNISRVAASGSIAEGANSIQIIPSSDFAGTIGGVAYAGADGKLELRAPENDWVGPLDYTRTAGSLLIVTLT
jgi:hypothetical protein